jgi:hypothetical protein
MNMERKCTIEPADILAIELECRNCGAASLIPIANVKPAEMARFAKLECRYCHTPNGFGENTAELDTLRTFLETTSAMVSVMRGRNLKLKLGIRCTD